MKLHPNTVPVIVLAFVWIIAIGASYMFSNLARFLWDEGYIPLALMCLGIVVLWALGAVVITIRTVFPDGTDN